MKFSVSLAITVLWIQTAAFAQDGKSGDVRVIQDVSFLGDERKEKLDLYLPPGGDERETYPAILVVHGGGWHGGDKAAAREKNIATNLAKAGYVCASINYRLAEKKERFVENLSQVWPGNLQNCMTGVQFLRAEAKTYQINPKRIGVIGGSAGGHLVAMLGVAGERDRLDPEDSPYRGVSCRVQAVVPLYGVHDFVAYAKSKKVELSNSEEDLCRKASPITYLSFDDPPFLIFHGSGDPLVPYAQSEILQRAAKKADVESELHIIKGAKHSFHLEPRQKDLRPLVVDFFDKHLK